MARCAACLTAFGPRDQRVVGDTEVFHAACASRIPHSLTNRLKDKVIGLHAQVKLLENDARDTPRLRVAIDDANRDARDIRSQRDKLEREIRDLRASGQTAVRSGEYFKERCEQLQREKESVERQLENATRELALMRALVEDPVEQQARAVRRTPDPPAVPPPSADPAKDDAAVRFSLLELDIEK